jgi:ABC-type phosphate transport system substrate-binding protein
MPQWTRRFGPPDPRRFAALPRRWLVFRVALYAMAIGALFVFRVLPGREGRPRDLALFAPADTTLRISGSQVAPGLVDRLAREYCAEYPRVTPEFRGGGTAHALEDLLNEHAEVAFLNRLPSAAEGQVIRANGDSVATYPIALGGIAILASTRSSWSEMSIEGLARTLGRGAPSLGDPERVYVPEPNLGLWGAVATQLELGEVAPVLVRWVAGEAEVVAAVAGDVRAIGLASTLALPAGFEDSDVQFVRLRTAASDSSFSPLHEALISGDYPLFHYLYVSCRPGSGIQAAAFITYVFSGRGQRMIDRAGYLPARDVPRLVQLVSRPIGSPGT